MKAIVIGAGPGGLVCANKLARSGLEVTLLERHDKVGGLAQAWVHRPRLSDGKRVSATFELTHAVSGFHEGGSNYKLFQELGADHDRIGPFAPARRFAALRTPDQDTLEVMNDAESNKLYLLERFPEERKGIEKIFRLLDKMNGELVIDRQKNRLKKALARFISKPPFDLLLKPNLVMHHKQTFQRFIDDCFRDERAHDEMSAWFSILYGYVGLPISQVSGNLHAAMLLDYWSGGGPQAPLENAFQAVHEELARAFVEENRGDLRLLSKVTGIHVDSGRVKGVEVETRRGRRNRYNLDADYVIVAGDMKKSILPLKEHLPCSYVDKLTDRVMSISLMSVHAIVESDLFEIEDRLAYAANVLASSRDALGRLSGDSFPDEYVLYVSVPTVLRPDAGLIRDDEGTPLAGHHIIDIVMESPSYERWAALRSEDRRKYRRIKNDVGNDMLRITEEMLIPDLRRSVRFKEVYTAKTHERFCDCTDGATYAFAATPDQFMPHGFSPKTPIDGLYLTGATVLSAGVGGAITGALMTASQIERDM